MFYPREDSKGRLVTDEQMVGIKELMCARYRTLTFHGEILFETGSCDTLLALDSISNDPIKLMVTSPGGSVDAAFLMYDTIKSVRSPVYTLGRFVASAAVIYLAAGQKGHRYLLPHSKVMLHLVSGQVQGNVKEWEIQNKEMQKYQTQMVDILRENGVKKSAKEVMKDIDRDFYLNAEEAIEYGLADKIMDAATLNEWMPVATAPRVSARTIRNPGPLGHRE